MTQVTVMVTLTYPDHSQPPDLDYIEAGIEEILCVEMERRNEVFKGCSQIEAEVENDE